MSEPPETFSTSKPALCGCLAGAAFLALVSTPLLFVLAWSGAHCVPAPECVRRSEKLFALEAGVVIALAFLFGFAVRALVRWAMLRGEAGEEGRAPPAWAVAVVVLLGLGALWILGPLFFP